MNNSVSKINVHLGANTSQLNAGMNQAAATVGKGMNRVQQASQQATYAVDDFFAGFATGGVAGGLRGAGNNLTQIAAMLGGIKTQLFVIGALAVGQFIAKQWEGAGKSIDKVNASLERFKELVKANSERVTELTSKREALRDIAGEDTVAGAEKRQTLGRTALEDMEAELEAQRSRLASLRQLKASVIGDEATQAVQDEIDEREKNSRALQEEIRNQKELNKATDEQLETLRKRDREQAGARFQRAQVIGDEGFRGFQPFVTQGMRDVTRMQLDDIEAELSQRRGRFSAADAFRMIPGAHAMGSADAVSTINAAQIGPQNVRDAGLAIQRQQAQDIKRLRELEERKKALLEVVNL